MKPKIPHRTRNSSANSEAAFSRVDLLAVISILALLGLLTRVTISASGLKVGGVSCANNLHLLAMAWLQFDADHGFLPPNPDDGNTIPGMNWVPGNSGVGGPQEFNPDLLSDPTRSLLWPYLTDASVFHCPEDLRTGKYQGKDPAKQGMTVPAARSYSMNGAVGADPYVNQAGTPPNAPWLDNVHAHRRFTEFRTYGKLDQVVDPSPSGLAVILDEDAFSLNDGQFAFGMLQPEWIDWPGTRHNTGANISFADGHVVLFSWVDPRTVVKNGNVSRLPVAGSEDYNRLRQHISAALPLSQPVAVVRSIPAHPADVKVVWPVPTNAPYRVDFSEDLTNWKSLGPVTPGYKEVSAVDPSPATSGKRFYRLSSN